MKPKKPRFQWPPEGDEAKQFHTEVAAGAVILRELGADIAIGPPATRAADGKAIRPKFASIDDWLKAQGSGMGGLIAGGARSWNHPQLLMAARGLALGDWGDAGKLMAMQAGRIPGEGAARFLDGEEPRSTDYDPYRWAAELIFLARGPKDCRDDTVRVLRRQMALASLGAVDWTDQGEEFRNRKGGLWYHGATLSPVGERSPKTSNPDQLGIFERLVMAGSGNDREGFCGAVADIVAAPLKPWAMHPPEAVAMLADVPIFGSLLFREYPEGRLVMRPEQLNPNTPTCLWSWADHATQRQTRGWPFPEGKQRGANAAKSMGCAIEGNVVVSRARTPEGQVLEAMYPLPKSAPLWSVRVDGKGARLE